MVKIAKQLTDLVGNTPLLELNKFSKDQGLEEPIIAKIEYFNPGGSVKDRIALAMIEDAEQNGILQLGAKTIRACASHCVMSGPASDRVQESALEEIVFTDSIPYTKRCAKVKQLSVADIFAEAIRRVINNESISNLYIV